MSTKKHRTENIGNFADVELQQLIAEKLALFEKNLALWQIDKSRRTLLKNCIAFDLEWNSPTFKQLKNQARLKHRDIIKMDFEIIQFGAFNLGEHSSTFNKYVNPLINHVLNPRIENLTGLDLTFLEKEGKDFLSVLHEFENFIFRPAFSSVSSASSVISASPVSASVFERSPLLLVWTDNDLLSLASSFAFYAYLQDNPLLEAVCLDVHVLYRKVFRQQQNNFVSLKTAFESVMNCLEIFYQNRKKIYKTNRIKTLLNLYAEMKQRPCPVFHDALSDAEITAFIFQVLLYLSYPYSLKLAETATLSPSLIKGACTCIGDKARKFDDKIQELYDVGRQWRHKNI